MKHVSPSFLVSKGILFVKEALRNNPKIKGALISVNASIVGILIAALYNPIWTSSIHSPIEFALAATLFSVLVFWKLPPWVIVLTGQLVDY